MRLVSVVAVVSLLLSSSSGCILAVAPAVGAGVAAFAGAVRKHDDPNASVTASATVGFLAGLLTDALLLAYVGNTGEE
jgi:uncharacterized protein YceK